MKRKFRLDLFDSKIKFIQMSQLSFFTVLMLFDFSMVIIMGGEKT